MRWPLALLLVGLFLLPIEKLHIASAINVLLLLATVAHWPTLKTVAKDYRWPVAFIFIGLLIGAAFSIQADKSMVTFRDLLRGAAAGLLFSVLITRYDLALGKALAIATLFAAGGLVLLYAWAGVGAGFQIEGIQQALGAIAHRNTWGLTTALIMNAFVVLALTTPSGPQRLGYLAGYGSLFLLCAMANPSRGALVGSALSGLFLLLLAKLPGRREIPVLALAVGGFVLGSLSYVLLSQSHGAATTTLDQLSSGRLSLYHLTWEKIVDSWLVGYGPRTFAVSVGQHATAHTGDVVATPHNILLEALYSMGLLGTAALMLGVAAFWWPTGADGQPRSPALTRLRLFGYAVFLQLILHGIFDLMIFSTYFNTLLFIAGAFIMATAPFKHTALTAPLPGDSRHVPK